MNFTSNSLKFTPANGSVVVRIRCVGMQDHGGSVPSSQRKPSLNSRKSKNSSKRRARASETSLVPPRSEVENIRHGHDKSNSTSNEDSKISIDVAGGTPQLAKVVEPRRSMSPPPLNTKDLIFEFEVEDTGPA